ncbi:hypothetical protein GCM10023156_10790 [Novipirellula rosea]|uniref:Uncharacterized protein n=1 Tax=Novipirellula rosea TaxID=1031540 RepID=A0ABP8MBT5_9BACT
MLAHPPKSGKHIQHGTQQNRDDETHDPQAISAMTACHFVSKQCVLYLPAIRLCLEPRGVYELTLRAGR